MTTPTKWVCAQRRLRLASASSQSDPSSLSEWRKLRSLATHWAHSEDSDHTGCPGWSESSLGAQSFCWFCHAVAHMIVYVSNFKSLNWNVIVGFPKFRPCTHILKYHGSWMNDEIEVPCSCYCRDQMEKQSRYQMPKQKFEDPGKGLRSGTFQRNLARVLYLETCVWNTYSRF